MAAATIRGIAVELERRKVPQCPRGGAWHPQLSSVSCTSIA